MISELLRPFLRVLFWSRWRPIVAAAVCLVVLAVIIRAVSGGSHSHPGGHPRPAPTVPAATAPATVPAASPAASASATPAASPAASVSVVTGPPPRAALTAARRFMSAWARRGPGWAAQLRPYATAQLAAQLSRTSDAYNPVTAVTGTAVVTSQAPGTVSLDVPTDAGLVLVTVRRTGGRWLAASVMLARTGD